MYILGISAFYHDSAACLIKDGEIKGRHLGFRTSESAELKQQISALLDDEL